MRTLAVIAIALLAAAGCGGGKHKMSAGSAKAQIEQNWASFFAASTPASEKVKLLQNGQKFAAVIQAQSKNPLASQSKAQVSNVSVSGSHATVTYTVTLAGTPVLKNQNGTAIKANGTWQVSDQSFCALLALQGGPPPPCKH